MFRTLLFIGKLHNTINIMSNKICRACHKALPLSEFHAHPGSADRLQYMCKECARLCGKANRHSKIEERRAKERAYYHANIEKHKAYHKRYRESHKEQLKAQQAAWVARQGPDRNRRYQLKRLYGIDLEHYDAILQRQGGVCAICRLSETTIDRRTGKPWPLAVDHNHNTGELRGLLCRRCNNALGSFKDDPILLQSAAEYLRSFLRPGGLDADKAAGECRRQVDI